MKLIINSVCEVYGVSEQMLRAPKLQQRHIVAARQTACYFMYSQGNSCQIKSTTQPVPLLPGWGGCLGTCNK